MKVALLINVAVKVFYFMKNDLVDSISREKNAPGEDSLLEIVNFTDFDKVKKMKSK